MIINHYAGSPDLGMEYRPYYMAKQFVSMGHKVEIIGASFSHLRTNQPIVEIDFSEETIDDISYTWIKTPAYDGNLSRILNIITFIFKIYLNAKKISADKTPDLVIASSTYPLDIYPSRKISRISGAKLCFEVHDLWPLSPMVIGGYSKFHPYIILLQKAENYAYRHSDKVVSLLGNAKEHMVKHGLDPDKFIHVPNGFDREEIEIMQEEVPAEHKKIINSLRNRGKVLVGYTGGHGPSNAMHTYVETARLFKEDPGIFFVSVGNGPLINELQLLAKNLDNILFMPSVPKKSIQGLLSMFDILYVGFVKSEIHRHGISPNKLIDYMIASKPIILSADVENEIVDKVGCGISVPAENPAEVHDAICEILELSEGERLKMGSRGKLHAYEELDYKKLAEKFLNSL